MRRLLAIVTLCLALAPRAQARDAFSHETHEGLFPSCRGCHEPGGAGIYVVGADDCAQCHDGDELGEVEWAPPTRPASLVRFDHSAHPYATALPGDDLECASCHGPDGKDEGMAAIVMPTPETCLECHNGSPEPHWSPRDVACGDCHLPLTAAPLVPATRIAAFPQPDSHASPDFLLSHKDWAREFPDACAVCHARESCERCHANADRVAEIQALERDERIATLVENREGGVYPTPADHREADWWHAHGTAASAEAERCANCHTADSCTGCHQQGFARLEVLPAAGRDGMPVLPLRPLDHTPRFAREHGALAKVQDCEVCHREDSFCSDCHEGQAGGGYHPPNFVLRHAASAGGPDPACAGCHSTEVFCRSCHLERGLSPSRSRANGYHDSEPLWLLNHGAAARQGLDQCATCHQQSDCLRCHSARSGWRINPHGPDFDADAVGEANKGMCLACHPASFLR